MKKALVIIITLLIMLAIVLGCIYWYKTATTQIEITSNEPIFTLENYPKVDASLAINPLVDSIASDFLGIDESELEFEYTTTRSSEVYRNLIDGKVDVIFAAEPSEDDLEQLSEMYKLYHGLGGNGQAQEFYERVLQLDNKPENK